MNMLRITKPISRGRNPSFNTAMARLIAMVSFRRITVVLKENACFPVYVIQSNESKKHDLVKCFVEKMHHRGDRPFVMMDLGQILWLFKKWNHLLPRFQVHYAVKSNHDPMLVAIMAAQGSSFDCATSKEIKQVLDLGVGPERIIFANPVKPYSHISYAVSENIHLSTFSCLDELEKVVSIDKNAKLVLRIAACDTSAEWQFEPTEKFGSTIESGKQLLHKAKTLGVEVVGTSFHLGCGVNNAKAYDIALRKCSEMFIYGKELGFNFTILDIGGGFKGYSKHLSELNDSAEVINASLKSYFKEFPDLKLIAEPGSFFSTSPPIICLKVLGKVKEEGNGKPLITYTLSDGKYGMLRDYKRDIFAPPIFQLQKGGVSCSSNLWGPTCSMDDVICRDVNLPEMQRNDWIWIEDMGSYSMCAVSGFNGFAEPSVYYYIHEEQLQSLIDMVSSANLKGIRLIS